MRTFAALLLKEEKAIFTSPIAYVVLSVFLVIMGYTFTLTLFVSHAPTLVHLFFQIYVLFLLTVPIITMRLVAEERRLRTIEMLLASHVLAEIERVASRVMILLDGRLLTTDAMREAGQARQLRLRVGGPQPAVLAALRHIPGVVDPAPAGDPESYLVEIAPGRLTAADLARAIVGQGFALSELVEVKPDLERVFLDLMRRASAMQANAA